MMNSKPAAQWASASGKHRTAGRLAAGCSTALAWVAIALYVSNLSRPGVAGYRLEDFLFWSACIAFFSLPGLAYSLGHVSEARLLPPLTGATVGLLATGVWGFPIFFLPGAAGLYLVAAGLVAGVAAATCIQLPVRPRDLIRPAIAFLLPLLIVWIGVLYFS